MNLRESLKRHFRFFLFLFIMVNAVNVVTAATFTQIPPHQSIQFYETQKKVDQVLFLMQKRLCIMHEVARSKWKNGIAIEDKAREEEILTAIGQQTKKYGIDSEWAQKFFKAQFEAAKAIQSNDFSQWTEKGINKFDSVVDIKTDVHAYIDRILEDLLQALSKIYPEIKSGKVAAFIPPNPLWRRDTDCIDAQIWNIATAPLLNK